ncbi:MAG: tRNA lysidine(34) synthetase TilS [Bacteroidota bacterium]
MFEYFLAFIERHQLIRSGERTILAISSGVDSMTMADLFLRSSYPFAVAHVNFGLRGKESDMDEEFVREWCKSNKIECFIQRAPKSIFEGSESVQMAARTFRYEYFKEVMKSKGFQKLATAHHLDDSLETTLFNFVRGTGLRGLKGISAQNEHVIRPLLFAEKEDIVAYATLKNISWREDASNEKDAYHRNKIRHHIKPVLKDINPGLMRSYQSVTERIKDSQDLVDQIVEGVLNRFQKIDGEVIRIDLEWMADYRNAKAILSEILRTYGFSYTQVKQIEESINAGMTGKLFYSGTYTLNLDRRALILKAKEERDSDWQLMNLIVPGETIVENRSIDSTIIEGNSYSKVSDPSIAYFDFDAIKEAKLNHWEEGDIFYPLGMKGKKKVSDFMIDSKIPLTLKRDVLILRSEGEIAWIVGYRQDERFKVKPETRRMLRLQLHQDV